MKFLGLGIILVSIIFLSTNLINAGIGFGMTDMQSEIIMAPNQNRVCVTYFIYNPGDIPIEGYLEISKEDGGTLNKLLGLDELYKQIDDLDYQLKVLQEEYDQIASSGESTYEIEIKINSIHEKIKKLNEAVEKKRPKQEKIAIPPHTPSKDEKGNYQIPIEICFDRPTEKYLFQEIGDTDFCGKFEGEILGRYVPISEETKTTGSAVMGARSTILKITIQCDINERKVALIRFLIGMGVILVVVIILISMIIKWKKKEKKNQEQM